MKLIELDGSEGEGGGQILRTALTLSMITGTPFRLERIRAKRDKPGLLRQHLTALNAAAGVCGALVTGAELGSAMLSFTPGKIRAGDYAFAIGTAGSCTLVLQTLLPALWFAQGPSSVLVSGGTHNSAAPPADFLMRAWWPLMQRMGALGDIALLRHGFYPAGGGQVRSNVVPIEALRPLHIVDRGEPLATRGIAVVAAVPGEVARRELDRLTAQLGPIDGQIRHLPANEGPGNALMVELQMEQVTEIFTAFGERGLPAITVADRVAEQARHYRDSTAAVGEYLADQLLLPMALAGEGSLTTNALSSHLRTNLQVIEKFVPVTFEVDEPRGRVSVTRRA